MAEFVSALCDGETIPRAAAEHVGGCAACRERLKEYMEMGAELRLMASPAMEESVSPRVWNRPRNRFAIWWQKGWKTMRIPRLAFAVLIGAVVGLGSMFAVVEVRAHSTGTVVMLKIVGPDGSPVDCGLSIEDKDQASCSALIGQMNGKTVGYRIDLIGRKGADVELAVRTKIYGPASGSYGLSGMQDVPQKQVLFEPGQTFKLDFAGVGTLTVTGEWLDHMPVFIGDSNHELDPGPEELRLISPLLIRDKQVLGDFQGGIAIADKAGQGVVVCLPGEGLFILSLSPMHGAVQARVALSRISFEDAGRSYVFVTGSPVARSEHAWVLHEANCKLFGLPEGHPFVSSGDLRQLAPGVLIDGESVKN